MTEQNSKSTADTAKSKSSLMRFLPLLIIGLALAAFFYFEGYKYISFDALKENRAALVSFVEDNWLLAIIGFILVYITLVAISFPGAGFLTIFGGFLFGLWAGTLAVAVGATLGAIIIFMIVKYAAGDALTSRASGFIKKLESGFQKDAFSYLFTLRLIPAVPFWALNIAAGAVNMKLRDYSLATFIGILPATFVYVSIGNGIGAKLDSNEPFSLAGAMTDWRVLLPIAGLIILSMIPIMARRFKATPQLD